MKLSLPNMFRISKIITAVCFVFSALNLWLIHPVSAAEVSLVISPPRYDETVKPGQTVQKTIKITNPSAQPIKVQAQVYDFLVQNDSGTPIQVTENASGRYLASPWFTLDRTSFVIAPGATEQIYALISVPSDALPGGHYAGVYISPQDVNAPAQTTGAGVLPQIGSLFGLTVAGDIKYDALIKSFTVKNIVSEFGPIYFEAVIVNQSDTHIRPDSQIIIHDMIGRKLAELPLDQVNIFPYTPRTLTAQWPTVWGFGRFTATLSAAYGPGLVAERPLYFWIMPYRLMAAILIILLVLLAVLIVIRRHLEHRADTRDAEIDELKRKIIEMENRQR